MLKGMQKKAGLETRQRLWIAPSEIAAWLEAKLAKELAKEILFCESNARSWGSSPTYSRCRGTQREQQPPEAAGMRLLTVGYGPHMGGKKHYLISFMCPVPTGCWQSFFVCFEKWFCFELTLGIIFQKLVLIEEFWKIPLLKMLSLGKDKVLQFKLQGCKPRDLFQNLCQLK